MSEEAPGRLDEMAHDDQPKDEEVTLQKPIWKVLIWKKEVSICIDNNRLWWIMIKVISQHIKSLSVYGLKMS